MMKKEQKRNRFRKNMIKLRTIIGCAPVPKGNTENRLLMIPVPV